jgi:cytochrome c oxidase subunit 4
MTSRPHGGIRYVLAWVGLLVLTTVSFGAAHLALGAAAAPVALGIASIKAGIVLVVFMHLMQTNPAVRTALGTAIVFILLLAAGIVADVVTR